MKFVVFAVLAFGVLSSNAQDDGRYRPEVYGGDDGKYRPSGEGRYVGNSVDYRDRYAVNYYRPSYVNNRAYRPLSAFPSANYYQTALPPTTVTAKPIYYQSRPLFYTRPLQDGERYARILKQDNQIGIDGYQYSYETENQIKAEESGKLEATPTGPGIRARGFYEYIGNDGVTYRVDYVADENGFHPSGAHLPQIPQV